MYAGAFLMRIFPGSERYFCDVGFACKTDSNGFITKAKPRLVARRFGQQCGVDYIEMFAPT